MFERIEEVFPRDTVLISLFSLQHAEICGAGTAVFLVVTSSCIIVIRGKRACLWGSVYLDSFGEEDRELKWVCCLNQCFLYQSVLCLFMLFVFCVLGEEDHCFLALNVINFFSNNGSLIALITQTRSGCGTEILCNYSVMTFIELVSHHITNSVVYYLCL